MFWYFKPFIPLKPLLETGPQGPEGAGMSETWERRNVGGFVGKLLRFVSWPAILSGGVALVLDVLSAVYGNFFMYYLALWFSWLTLEFVYAKFAINELRDKFMKEAEEVRHRDLRTRFTWLLADVSKKITNYTLPFASGSLLYYLFLCIIFTCKHVFVGIENSIADLLAIAGIALTLVITFYIERETEPDPEIVGIKRIPKDLIDG